MAAGERAAQRAGATADRRADQRAAAGHCRDRRTAAGADQASG
jgi:hypothetical protein